MATLSSSFAVGVRNLFKNLFCIDYKIGFPTLVIRSLVKRENQIEISLRNRVMNA